MEGGREGVRSAGGLGFLYLGGGFRGLARALALGHYNIGWVRPSLRPYASVRLSVCRSTAAKIAKANMADVAWNLFLL